MNYLKIYTLRDLFEISLKKFEISWDKGLEFTSIESKARVVTSLNNAK